MLGCDAITNYQPQNHNSSAFQKRDQSSHLFRQNIAYTYEYFAIRLTAATQDDSIIFAISSLLFNENLFPIMKLSIETKYKLTEMLYIHYFKHLPHQGTKYFRREGWSQLMTRWLEIATSAVISLCWSRCWFGDICGDISKQSTFDDQNICRTITKQSTLDDHDI